MEAATRKTPSDIAEKQTGADRGALGGTSARKPAADFAEIAAQVALQFPPVLSPQQAAELVQLPLGTIYDWSSRGVLGAAKRRVGRRLRILRDPFLRLLFEDKLHA